MVLVRTLIVLVVVAACGVARADVDSPDVLAGVAAYNDLEYDKAIERLQKALRTTLTREEKLVAYKTLAFCHFAVGKRELAVQDFQMVLRIDDSFDLDRRSPPAERAVFEEARARVATGRAPSNVDTHALSTLKPEISPPKPKAGQAVQMRVFYPGGLAQTMDLFFRTRGLGLYTRLEAKGDAAGHFNLNLAPAQVQAPGIEYYLIALDDSGASVAKAGSLARPWLIDVTPVKKPVYKRGWFWGVLVTSVVVAGAAVGTSLALTRNTNTSSSTVTLSPY
jgi:tetratricopeptide (TPR) repeat protein